MSDVTQGQDQPDDASLFNDATTTTTLEKFENPELPKETPKEPAKTETPLKEAPKEAPKEQVDAPVPAGRLREESEARRRAERERDDLLRQVAAARTPPQPQQKPDLFENPSNFVQSEMRPFFEQVQQQMRMQTEAFSEQLAGSAHGFDKVETAKQALADGMRRGDPDVKAVWERAMQSQHPYDVITKWHINHEAMREVGGDLKSYRQRVIDEAMKDPNFQRQWSEAQRNNGGTHVARPVTSSVPKIPSLGNVGAGGGEADLQEPSDEQLFRAAVTARRK